MPESRGTVGGEPIPPFHHPVFVLTHHARPPLALEGGTSFAVAVRLQRAEIPQAYIFGRSQTDLSRASFDRLAQWASSTGGQPSNRYLDS
jgi:hypothetical protein